MSCSVETGCDVRMGGRATRDRFVCEETEILFETVPAGSVAVEVSLASLDSLPEGARFGARDGRVELAVVRRGDRLSFEARSDSLARQTVRSSRTEAVRRSDTVSVRTAAQRTVAVDSLRCDSAVVETVTVPCRSSGRWWFLAGVVLCLLFFVRLRR